MEHTFLTKNVMPTGITIKSVNGSKIRDENDKEYLDFSSETLPVNYGNRSASTFFQGLADYTSFSPQFHDDLFIELSKKFINLAPKGLTKVNLRLTNPADAIESAVARTRLYRKKPYIISFYWSNYGGSSEALRASGKHVYGGFSYFIPLTPPFLQLRSEAQVLTKIEMLIRSRTDIGGILLKPLMIEAGVHSFSPLFLKTLRKLCDKYSVTLIFDENQLDFGWLGTLFAADYFGVIPDIIALGDSLSSGLPLAGVLMKPEYDVLELGYDERLFGGLPLSCAIALQNLEYLEKSNILTSIGEKIRTLAELTQDLAAQYPIIIAAVRTCGLITGIEFITAEYANRIYEKVLKAGLILRKTTEGEKKTLVLKPPVIITDAEITEAIAIITDCVEELV